MNRPSRLSAQGKKYNVFIHASNGAYTQLLRLSVVNRRWIAATRVSASYSDGATGLVSEEIEKEFPGDFLTGDSDSRGMDTLKRLRIE